MRWSSNKLLTFFISAILVFLMVSLVLMPSPVVAQDEKSKELTFTETDSFIIENDYIQIKFVKKRPFVEWYSNETGKHKLSLSIKGITEYFDKNPDPAGYDNGDTIYRNFAIDDPNQLFGKGYDVTKSIGSDKITLTFRVRGDILDTTGDDVGFADVRFVFKIFSSESGAAVYAPQDGVEMAIEVIVDEWDYASKEFNVLALNTSLEMQSGDAATIDGQSVQTMNDYKDFPVANLHLVSVSNSTGAQMGYIRLADKDNQDTDEHHTYRATGTQIAIMSSYSNIGKSRVHQMSLGVPESLSSPTDQGQGGFGGLGDVTSIFQGLPGILSNILFIEIIVIVAVLAVIAIVLVRRTKQE